MPHVDIDRDRASQAVAEDRLDRLREGMDESVSWADMARAISRIDLNCPRCGIKWTGRAASKCRICGEAGVEE
jgi:hypothetical protein